MATAIRDIAQQVIADLGLDWGYEMAAQWVGRSYSELASRAKFRHLRQYGQLYVPAPINTGTCTTTIDSPSVTLDAAALAACQTNKFLQWPDGFTGLFFRPALGRVWSRIARAQQNGTLTLETPFASDNAVTPGAPAVQANQTFFIIKRFLPLDPTARQLGIFVADFMYRQLDMVSEDELNAKYSNRFLVWAYPQFVAELNSDLKATGIPKVIELYPYPAQSTTLHYTFWQTPVALSFEDYLPPTIDPDIVRDRAMAYACSNRAGAAVRAGKLEEAAYYNNLRNQHTATFEKKVNRAIRNDRGAEDLGVILKQNGWRPPLDWDPIKDAFDNFIARGI